MSALSNNNNNNKKKNPDNKNNTNTNNYKNKLKEMKERLLSSSKAQKQTRRSTFDINHKEVITISLTCCEIDRRRLMSPSN